MNQVKCGLRSVFYAICVGKQHILALLGLALLLHRNRTVNSFIDYFKSNGYLNEFNGDLKNLLCNYNKDKWSMLKFCNSLSKCMKNNYFKY